MLNKAKNLNACKTGAHSRRALLPNEKLEEFEKLRKAWYDELTPHGLLLAASCDSIIFNRWQDRRASEMLDFFVQSQPLGRALLESGKEEARATIESWRLELTQIAELAVALKQQLPGALQKTELLGPFLKAVARMEDSTNRIADNNDRVLEFFLGLGEAARKQSERKDAIDVEFHKKAKNYMHFKECAATSETLKNLKPSSLAMAEAEAESVSGDDLPLSDSPAPPEISNVDEDIFALDASPPPPAKKLPRTPESGKVTPTFVGLM